MQLVKIPPEKVATFDALKSEFDSLQKKLDDLACQINATKPFPRDLFEQLREMQRRSIAITNEMVALGTSSEL